MVGDAFDQDAPAVRVEHADGEVLGGGLVDVERGGVLDADQVTLGRRAGREKRAGAPNVRVSEAWEAAARKSWPRPTKVVPTKPTSRSTETKPESWTVGRAPAGCAAGASVQYSSCPDAGRARNAAPATARPKPGR